MKKGSDEGKGKEFAEAKETNIQQTRERENAEESPGDQETQRPRDPWLQLLGSRRNHPGQKGQRKACHPVLRLAGYPPGNVDGSCWMELLKPAAEVAACRGQGWKCPRKLLTLSNKGMTQILATGA